VDSAGSVYVVGTTHSSDFPTTGGFETSYGGSRDAFVTKVNAAGSSLAWSSFLGGGDYEDAWGVALDSAGNVYVTGGTYSSDFPTTGGFDTTWVGGDAFVTEVSAAGSSLAWSSFLGGSSSDVGNGVAVDSAANVYVVGTTYSTDLPTTGGFDTTFSGGVYDAFVTKVNAGGASLSWSSYLGGGGADFGQSIAVDSTGNVYVVGRTNSSDFPTTGAFDMTFSGGIYDAFVTKVKAAGSSLAWSSYLGGADDDSATGVALDSAGNVYVAGYTASSDFPATGGFDTAYGGSTEYDAFVTKVDAAGSSLAWSSYLGGASLDGGGTIATDPPATSTWRAPRTPRTSPRPAGST
jgi:beta-propeller repeat-containing protein